MQNTHSHVWDQQLHMSAEAVRESDLSRGYPLDLTTQPQRFLEEMAPFDKVITFGLKAALTGFWVPDEYVAEFCARAPHLLIGFACCDPTQPCYLEELHHGIEGLHLRGLKMGPIYAGFDPRDPRCDPVYAFCQQRGLPIVFHTGTTFSRAAPLGFSRPWLYDDVAIRYPDLRIVLAHVGHPFCEECLVVIRKHPHVYADIAAIYYRPWQFYNCLIAAQEYRVTHKLLFGTDYPFAGTADSIAGLRQANALVEATSLPRVSTQVIEELLARDSLSLLGID